MCRYFAYLSYDGAAYHGWQVQPGAVTVEETVERCLATILRSPTDVTAAGRTDAGVSALVMPAHFDTAAPLCPGHGQSGEEQLAYKMNRLLPRDIAVSRIVRVRDDAHARFSAVSRTYRYFVSLRKTPFAPRYSLQLPAEPDFTLMNAAARMLLGTHDFDCFAKAHPDVKTSICRVERAEWRRVGAQSGVWMFEIKADRFLRNMVRAIVGTLLEIGRHRLDIQDLDEIMCSRDRRQAGESVAGTPLFLADVAYPDDIFYEFPDK